MSAGKKIAGTAFAVACALGLGTQAAHAAAAAPAATCGTVVVHVINGPATLCGVGTWVYNGSKLVSYVYNEGTGSNRVWLHQNGNGSGWAVCLYPWPNTQVPVQGAYQHPGNVQVSSNTSPC